MTAGWRISTVHPDGTIAGFPPHKYPWTPDATCINGHPAPHRHCACGHHITTDLDQLLHYARNVDTIAAARAWGTYSDSRTHPDDGTARVLIYAATAGDTHGPRSWDPPTTLRSKRLHIVAAHVPDSARHLAEPIRRRYPHLTVHIRDSDNYSCIT